MIPFTGERIVPQADNCEPLFAQKMYQEHLARYAFASQWVQGKTVLDVGCGVGYGAQWLAGHGANSVLAFDLSSDAIQHATEFYFHPNLEFQVASAEDFNFGKRFDVVTCFELIEHISDPHAAIQCIRNALTDDGVLIISTPRRLESKRTSWHVREFSESEFRELLTYAFPQVHFYFENNHFSSLITNAKPNRIERVLPITEQFTLAQADYFVAVASPLVGGNITNDAKSTMVIGDEAYVKLLERDVDILHASEARLMTDRDEQNARFAQAASERDTSISLLLKQTEGAYEQQMAEKVCQYETIVREHVGQIAELQRQLKNQFVKTLEQETIANRQLRDVQLAHERHVERQAIEHSRQLQELRQIQEKLVFDQSREYKDRELILNARLETLRSALTSSIEELALEKQIRLQQEGSAKHQEQFLCAQLAAIQDALASSSQALDFERQYRLEQANEQKARARRVSSQLEARLAELKTVTNRWAADRRIYEAALTELRDEIDSIRASYSNTVYQPLRSIMAFLEKSA